jgi:hypothetical protein
VLFRSLSSVLVYGYRAIAGKGKSIPVVSRDTFGGSAVLPRNSAGSGGRGDAGSDMARAVAASLEDSENDRAREQQAIGKVWQALPSGKVVFDVPRNGLCGYYAMLVMRKVMDSPQTQVVDVSMADVKSCLKRVGEQILRQANEIENADDRVDPNTPIVILGASFLGDERYKKYIVSGKIDWNLFCGDLMAGKIWLDHSFFPFARAALNLLPDMGCVDGANPQALGAISHNGALVRVGGNHFVVALPTSEGGVGEVRCQDRNGRWWSSKPQSLAVPE